MSAAISAEQVSKRYPQGPWVAALALPGRRPWGDCHPPRAQWLRQVHRAAAPQRARARARRDTARPGHSGARTDAHGGMMFQEPRLLPWRTVRESIAFGLLQVDAGRAGQEARGAAPDRGAARPGRRPASQASSPAEWRSGLPSRAAWPVSLRCCCSMGLQRRRRADADAPQELYLTSGRAAASPCSSSSPTTSTRRSSSATGWWCCGDARRALRKPSASVCLGPATGETRHWGSFAATCSRRCVMARRRGARAGGSQQRPHCWR